MLFGRYYVFCVLALTGLVTFDLLTLKLVRKSHVWWRPFLLILGFLGFLILELFVTNAREKETDGQTDEQTKAMHNAPPLWGVGIIIHTRTHFNAFHQPFFGYIRVSQWSQKSVQSLWTFIQQHFHRVDALPVTQHQCQSTERDTNNTNTKK